MKQIYILICLFIIGGVNGNSQILEDFEDETSGTTQFQEGSDGQLFSISKNPVDTGDSYRVGSFTDAGWNGTAVDQIYIETLGADNDNDGTSFVIETSDASYIAVESLYFFISTKALDNTINSVLTIEGKRNDVTIYTITKSSGFSDVETFSPNNGYTFIDFSTEGGSDNSDTAVNQLFFTTTNDGDYVSLDALTWNDTPTLSTNNIENKKNINIFPNPTTEFIQLSGLSETENYTIYNALGREVNNGVISDNEKIEVKTFSNGLYFLKLENGKIAKFIKK